MHVKLCATCGGVTFLHHRTLSLSFFFLHGAFKYPACWEGFHGLGMQNDTRKHKLA